MHDTSGNEEHAELRELWRTSEELRLQWQKAMLAAERIKSGGGGTMTAYGRREDDFTGVPLMRLRDAAMALAVSPDFLQDHCKTGQIAHIRMGRRIMIPRSVVEQLARDGLPSIPGDD